jgi:hypothetical protein
VCVAAAALTASVDAAADHHYGILLTSSFPVDANDGSSTLIRSDTLHSTCNILTHTFVNHEMWYNTDASGHWVEVGFKDGATNGINCVQDMIFWADSRPGGGYNEHYYNNGWSFGLWYQAQVTTAGSCKWNVTLGGLNLGSSTANCPGSTRYLSAGIEATNQDTGSVKGFLFGWEEQNASGTWVLGWDGVSPPNNGLVSDNPPNILFLSNEETEEAHLEPLP